MADSDGLQDMDDLRDAIKDLKRDVDTLEDKVMMERLEDMAIEDEIEAVENIVGRSQEELRDKLNLLDQIAERSEELRVDEKLKFLYSRIKELEDAQEETGAEEQFETLADRLDEIEQSLQDVMSDEEDRDLDDVYDKLYTLRDRVQEISSEGVPEADREALRNEVADAVRDRIDELEQQIDAVKESTDSDAIQDELADLQEQIDSIETGGVSDDIERRIASLEETVDDLETGSADAVRNELEGRIEELRDQMDDVAGADISGMEGELSSLQETVSDIQRQIGRLEQSVEDVEGADASQIEALRDEMDDRFKEAAMDGVDEKTLDQITEELRQSAERDVDDLRKTVERLSIEEKVDKEELDARIDDLKDYLSSERGGIVSEVREQIEQDIKEFEEMVADAERRNQQLRETVEEDVGELRAAVRAVEERSEEHATQDDIDDIRETVDAIRDEMDDHITRDDLDAVQETLSTLQETVETHDDRFAHISSTQDRFEEKIGSILEQQQEFNRRLQEGDEHINKKIDMVIEALEEGLSEEDQQMEKRLDLILEALEEGLSEEERKLDERIGELRDLIEEQESAELDTEEIDDIEERVSELDQEIEAVSSVNQNIEEALGEYVEEELGGDGHPFQQLAKIVSDNQRRIKQLQEQIEDTLDEVDRQSPTIIE